MNKVTFDEELVKRMIEEAVKQEREAIAKWLEDERDAPYWAESVRARGQA